MVTRVRIRDIRILPAGLPVEFSGFYDYASERCAVAADKLGRGMDNDVSAVFDRPDQVRRAEGIIDHDRKSVFVRDL